jgi:hypothetical protein
MTDKALTADDIRRYAADLADGTWPRVSTHAKEFHTIVEIALAARAIEEDGMKYVHKTVRYEDKLYRVARAFRIPTKVLLTIVLPYGIVNHESYNDVRFGTAHDSVSLLEGPAELPWGSYRNVELSAVAFPVGQPGTDAPEPEQHACTCDITRLMRFGCTCGGI